ncbi:AAT-domain-containing protein [Ramaria rubella]|nr:AAT-domain-containing protein [Ramaria rubella]
MVVRVDLKGSSHEIGLQHGRALRAQIIRQITFYGTMFKARCNLEWSQVLEISQEFKATISKLTPDILEEMEGVAEGVNEPNVGVLDIVALNCRSEIALGKWTEGCTSLGWNVQGTSPKQYLAQNWDWDREMEDNIALMSIARPSKPQIWMVTEAGIIGKIGFNSSSVGVCLNAIRAIPMIPTLLPVHVLLRLVLESESVSAAINQLETLGGCATSAHMLIADPSGSRGAEISPLGMSVIQEDEDRVVVHSNHFILNRLVEELKWLEDSPGRIQRIRELCAVVVQENKDGSLIDMDRMRTLFRDRNNPPGSICRRLDAIESLFNIVMDLREGYASAEIVFKIGAKDEAAMIRLP